MPKMDEDVRKFLDSVVIDLPEVDAEVVNIVLSNVNPSFDNIGICRPTEVPLED